MRRGKIWYILLPYMLFFNTVMAENYAKHMKKYYVDYKAPDIADELAKSIDFGFSTTSGTTNTLNINGRFRTFYTFVGLNNRMIKLFFDARVFIAESDNIKNDEEYRINFDFEQDLDIDWLWYGNATWFQNRFKNYDAVFSNNIGFGYKFLQNDSHSLTFKFGLGYNMEKYTNYQKDKKYASLNQYLEYNNKLTPTNHLYTKIALIQNIEDISDDNEILSIFGIDFMIGKNLSFAIEQEIYYDALTSEGKKTVDTKTIAKIGYRF